MKPRLYLVMYSFALLAISMAAGSQNRDPLKTEIITTDLDNFWAAFDQSGAAPDAGTLQKFYLDKGSKGLKGFMAGRIKNADYLAQVIAAHPRYYPSIRKSTDSIAGMKQEIIASLAKLKELYPPAVFPPVYFVIGALNSGGTTSNAGLIIGAEMYGLTTATPVEELSAWLRTVIKPVGQVPHIVAHELVHFQQKYDGHDLLSASIKEGAADFVAELISGKHINQHVHDYANPRERELWTEFKDRMSDKDYKGWMYSSEAGRPNDLGYWMGYQITKSYYDQKEDKKQAIREIMNIRDFRKFLEQSKYPDKFK